jgi:DNA-binding response OmpR family regulator
MEATILYIEKKRSDQPSFIPALRKKGFSVESVTSGTDAVEILEQLQPQLAIINAASLRTNGKRICRSLRGINSALPIIVILDPSQLFKDDDCSTAIMRMPFTARKLINHILLYIKGSPETIISSGPIRLDLERKTVQCIGKETRLTPRLLDLLQYLLENKGVVIEREQLFSTVWKTQYTGDTRTLDVHISWLRNAIEEDPRHPQLIKTIRSYGYRLDIA